MTFEISDRRDDLTPHVQIPTHPTHPNSPNSPYLPQLTQLILFAQLIPQIIKLTQLTHMLISASKKRIELDKSLPTDRMNSIL